MPSRLVLWLVLRFLDGYYLVAYIVTPRYVINIKVYLLLYVISSPPKLDRYANHSETFRALEQTMLNIHNWIGVWGGTGCPFPHGYADLIRRKCSNLTGTL